MNVMQSIQKIRIANLAKSNPAQAFLLALDMFNKQFTALKKESDKEIKNVVVAQIEMLKKELPDFDKIVESIKGNDGDDADPMEVAELLIEMPEFIALTKAKDVGPEELSEIAEKVLPMATPKKGVHYFTKADINEFKDYLHTLFSTIPFPTISDVKDIVISLLPKEKPAPSKEKESISKSEYKKVVDEIASIKKVLQSKKKRDGGGSGGGGSGHWVHEEFSSSSATTTVTLRYNVAAGGNAILVRYQGQLLFHGVHYSISGKVITLTFTPDDNTKIEVTYVRTS